MAKSDKSGARERQIWPGAVSLVPWVLFGCDTIALRPAEWRASLLRGVSDLLGQRHRPVWSRRACPECSAPTHYVPAWPMGNTYTRKCTCCDFAETRKVKLVKQL